MADLIKREDVNEVIDALEVYTVGRMNIEKVQISVLQLQRFINTLKNIPTAYDVEAVVAELHEILEEFYQMKPHDQENPYNEGVQKGYKCSLEIVRKSGKHLKGCVNCKHQSEQRTACEWYKSQGLFLRECPEWVRKE